VQTGRALRRASLSAFLSRLSAPQVLEWYLARAGAVKTRLAADPLPNLPPIAPHARPAAPAAGDSDDDDDED
jgi:hypothetical protein